MEPHDFADPAFRPLVLPNAPLLTLGTGFARLESQVRCASANQLPVSDPLNDRIFHALVAIHTNVHGTQWP